MTLPHLLVPGKIDTWWNVFSQNQISQQLNQHTAKSRLERNPASNITFKSKPFNLLEALGLAFSHLISRIMLFLLGSPSPYIPLNEHWLQPWQMTYLGSSKSFNKYLLRVHCGCDVIAGDTAPKQTDRSLPSWDLYPVARQITSKQITEKISVSEESLKKRKQC